MTTAKLVLGVSIVICCHNSAQRLPPTLDHLKKQVVPAGIPWEVIVVDNASTDQTTQTAIDLWDDFLDAPFRVVSETRPGLSNARMKGFQQARYEFVSLVDDDNWVADDWVSTVFQIMNAHPEVGACGGKSEGIFEVEPPEWYQQYIRKIAVGEQSEIEGDITDSRGWLWGAGLNIRKSAWQNIIDKQNKFLLTDRRGTKLTSGGDNEICYILKLLGWRLYYSPQLSLKHFISKDRISWGYFCKMAADNGHTEVVNSRYHKYFQRNILQKRSQYVRHWGSTLYSLVKIWKKNKPQGNNEQLIGSKEYFDHLLLSKKILEWIKIGPLGVYKIDRSIRRWEK